MKRYRRPRSASDLLFGDATEPDIAPACDDPRLVPLHFAMVDFMTQATAEAGPERSQDRLRLWWHNLSQWVHREGWGQLVDDRLATLSEAHQLAAIEWFNAEWTQDRAALVAILVCLHAPGHVLTCALDLYDAAKAEREESSGHKWKAAL